MKTMLLATATLGLLALAPEESPAQQVRIEAVFGSPVERVVVDDRYYDRDAYVHRYPARRVVVHHYAPRVIVIDRVSRRNYSKHYRRNYRPVYAWYDHGRSRYYDRHRPGLRQVSLYQYEGRYYHPDDVRYFRDDNRGRDRDYRNDDRNSRDRDRDDDRYDRDDD